MVREVKDIEISQIHAHPDNPRKNVGDVSELAKSIKANGIMQNLTVTPGTEGYCALIGHRRLAAAKEAGLKTVPCIIVEGLSYQEQIALMLEENMQRNDLTIPEQAQSFQLMLDLGATIEDLKEKTGFSETTIRHRINLAKLDKEILHEATQEYQITISDLIELEKIDDVEERNRILSDSRDHNQIVNKVAAAVREKKRKEHAEKVLFLLESQKIKAAPQKTNRWDRNVEVLHEISIDDNEKPKQSYTAKHDGDLRYIDASKAVWNPTIAVVEITKPQKEEKKASTQKELNEKELKEHLKAMEWFRREAIKRVIEGKARYKGDEDIVEKLYLLMEKYDTYVGQTRGAEWMAEKSKWDMDSEEKQEWIAKFMELPIITRMLIITEKNMNSIIESIKNYDGTYDEEDGERAKEWYDLLKDFGLITNKEYDAILDGSSHLYANK